MDLREALNNRPEIVVQFNGLTLYFTLRNPTNEEDLEFRRRSAKVQLKGRKLESGDDALNAPIWLLDKIKEKVEYSNGQRNDAGDIVRTDVSREDYRDLPQRLKLGVISRYLSEIEGEETDALKN